jgi:hypothetical protein
LLNLAADGACTTALVGTIAGADAAALDSEADAWHAILASIRRATRDGAITDASRIILGEGDTRERAFAKLRGVEIDAARIQAFARLIDFLRSYGETSKGAILPPLLTDSIARTVRAVGIARHKAVKVGGCQSDATHRAAGVVVDTTIANLDLDTDPFVFAFIALTTQDLGGSAVAVLSLKQIAGLIFGDRKDTSA